MVDVPPGRAGRLWLVERLGAARRGAELLERQRQLLRRQQRRLSLLVEETEHAWADALAAARRWELRAAVLGGTPAALRTAGPVAGRAEVEVVWRNTMGVRHPDDARCQIPALDPTELAAADAAVGPAAAAYGRAIEAAVAHAVTSTALREVEAGLAKVQRRLRALEHHRIPALEEELATLMLRLEERELEERVVTRWAQRTRAAGTVGRTADTARLEGDRA
jgi:V/A-type H+-transporting ATPase subunit D